MDLCFFFSKVSSIFELNLGKEHAFSIWGSTLKTKQSKKKVYNKKK